MASLCIVYISGNRNGSGVRFKTLSEDFTIRVVQPYTTANRPTAHKHAHMRADHIALGVGLCAATQRVTRPLLALMKVGDRQTSPPHFPALTPGSSARTTPVLISLDSALRRARLWFASLTRQGESTEPEKESETQCKRRSTKGNETRKNDI